MSVLLPGSWSAAANEPVVIDDLPNYFLQGAKPRTDWRIGAEFEKFALEAETGRAITFDEPGGIRDILQALVDQFGWEPHANDGHGPRGWGRRGERRLRSRMRDSR